MANVTLSKLSKVYPNGFKAVKSIDLEIEDKEFMILVGPSGCGKTTTLRMIAGLEDISEGELSIGGELMNHVEPKDRNIAMVFQNYALYPHMSVYENMAFGLKINKTPKAEIHDRITKAAGILGIDHLLDRKPKQLSGGQRQRVALGRAIVRKPKVFLMDEPLSNLDAKLRVQMRAELIKLHNDLQTTIVYVTHDQTEAMTMGSRICVMNDGIIQQVADPKTIYNHPANLFVAGFIGSPQMNFAEGELAGKDLDYIMNISGHGFKLDLDEERVQTLKPYCGKRLIVGFRPENIMINKAGTGLRAEVTMTELLGNDLNVHCSVGDTKYVCRAGAALDIHAGDEIYLDFDTSKIHLFDQDTKLSIG